MDGAKASILASLEAAGRFDESEEGFEKSLQSLAKAYRKDTGFPLTIIVDELDRCSPTYALRLIERIKRFFEVDSVCFLLFANVSQLERQIERKYGAIDSANYLRKFADVRMSFPENHKMTLRGGAGHASDYVRTLKKIFNCGGYPYCEAWDGFGLFVNPLRLSLREVEAVARQLMLVEASNDNYHSIVGPLAALRVKNEIGYERLKAIEVDALGLFALFGIDPEVELPYRSEAPLADLASVFLSEKEYGFFCEKLGDLAIFPRWRELGRCALKAIESLEVFEL